MSLDQVIDQEMRRFELWQESLEKKRRRVKAKKMTKEEFTKEQAAFHEKQFKQEVLL